MNLRDFVSLRLRTLAADIEAGDVVVAEYTDAAWGLKIVVAPAPEELPSAPPQPVQPSEQVRACGAGNTACDGGQADVRQIRVGVGANNYEWRCVKCNEEVPHGGPTVG